MNQHCTYIFPLVRNQVQQYLILVLYCMFCHETNNAPPPLRVPIRYSFVNVCQVLVTRPPTIRIHLHTHRVTHVTSYMNNSSVPYELEFAALLNSSFKQNLHLAFGRSFTFSKCFQTFDLLPSAFALLANVAIPKNHTCKWRPNVPHALVSYAHVQKGVSQSFKCC